MGNAGVSDLCDCLTTRAWRLYLDIRGNSELEEPVAIRPTSETVMYPCEFPETLRIISLEFFTHG